MQHVFLRTVPGGVAAAAVLGLGLAGPAAAACGQPAQPAHYATVVTPAVTRTIPAVTHVESLWTRQLTTTLRQATRTTPGYDVLRWSRTTEQREAEYAEKVVDQAFVPAVPGTPAVYRTETVVVTPAVTVTLWEYEQLMTGNKRWEEEGWNAGPKGNGWTPTGATDVVEAEPAVTAEVQVLVSPEVPGTPEVPEVSHLEHHWLPEDSTPPAGWTATGATRVASSSTQDVDLPEGQSPEGTGWVLGAVVDTVAAVVETVWLGAGESAPDGFAETGVVDEETATETTAAPSQDAPAGDGWARVSGTETTVVDHPEQVVVVTPETTTQVLVTPAVPAEPACPSAVSPPQSGDAAPAGAPVVSAPAPAAAQAGLLPATGSEVPRWVPAVGLTSLLAGLGLVRRARRTAGD